MGSVAGSTIVTSNLVFNMDSSNPKSIMVTSPYTWGNNATIINHGWAEWFCVESGTATYSIVSSGVSILERTTDGLINTKVASSTGPTSGTFVVLRGNVYYSSGGPINLVVEDNQHRIIPTSMAGTQFYQAAARYAPTNLYVVAHSQPATINFFDNKTNGLTDTPSQTITLRTGETYMFQSANLGSFWISSNYPILASAAQMNADRTILSPMTNYVYNRFLNSYGSNTNTLGTTTAGSYVVYDTSNNVMSVTIADGSGGDCCQGLGYEYLANRFSFGNYLSDYVIVAPYPSTIINTYYWWSANSTWLVWESHTISGTQTSPAMVMRDGTNGPGVTATIISGGAAYMNTTSTLWKWESSNPIFLGINDTADDEFAVLGWTANTTLTPIRNNLIKNMTPNDGTNGVPINGPTYSNNSIIFDGINDFINCGKANTLNVTNNFTIEVWFNANTFNTQWQTLVAKGDREYRISKNSANNVLEYSVGTGGGANLVTGITNIQTGTYYCATMTYSLNDHLRGYLNGVLQANSVPTVGFTSSSYDMLIGENQQATGRYWNGRIDSVKIYNRALNAEEVLKNFTASRGRFGV